MQIQEPKRCTTCNQRNWEDGPLCAACLFDVLDAMRPTNVETIHQAIQGGKRYLPHVITWKQRQDAENNY